MKDKTDKTQTRACPAKGIKRPAFARACPANAVQRARAGALVLAGSHRKGGNSDHAAYLLGQTAEQAGHQVEIVHVRDYPVLPCLGCGHCAKSTGHACVLATKDRAEELFAKIVGARFLFIASPIYFYHLPSMFKTIIDRGQRFWEASLDNTLDIPDKTCGIALVAARDKGENLFTGSLLTLKYFLKPFNARISGQEVFYGVDKPGDFAKNTKHHDQLIQMAGNVLQTG